MAYQENDWTEQSGIMESESASHDGEVSANTEKLLASGEAATPVTDISKSGRVIKKSAKLIEMENIEKVEKFMKDLGAAGKSSSAKKIKLTPAAKKPKPVPPLRLSVSSADRQQAAGAVSTAVSAATAVMHDASHGKGQAGRPRKVLQHRFATSTPGGSVQPVKQPVKLPNQSGVSDSTDDATATSDMKRKKVFTAYVLWCNEQRAQLLAQNPDLDFSAISRRLAEIWHTVPEQEKMVWRRKAQKMTQKSSSMISTGKTKTGRVGRPSLSDQQRLYPPTAARPLPPSAVTAAAAVISATAAREKTAASATAATAAVDTQPVNTFKVVGTDHVDVAAHLKLLGESLTVIGDRLKEHKGQIAVQGSLSVLLDSLLCALGPIMCLTNQVPELNGCPEAIHVSTLDNIAYIMPGVG